MLRFITTDFTSNYSYNGYDVLYKPFILSGTSTNYGTYNLSLLIIKI